MGHKIYGGLWLWGLKKLTKLCHMVFNYLCTCLCSILHVASTVVTTVLNHFVCECMHMCVQTHIFVCEHVTFQPCMSKQGLFLNPELTYLVRLACQWALGFMCLPFIATCVTPLLRECWRAELRPSCLCSIDWATPWLLLSVHNGAVQKLLWEDGGCLAFGE